MTLRITDEGDRRTVEIAGEQRGYGGVVSHSLFTTHYVPETLQALAAAKGEMWLRDEIARAEEPSYVQEPLRRQCERYLSLRGKALLDFGCGCGASSLALARLGAASVMGVEPDSRFVEAARLRARDSGLDSVLTFVQVPDTTKLPFPAQRFDAVIMNAVLEHIPPRLRRQHLQEVWRVVRPGGHLLIGETPNRSWPQDYHTTGLWWVPYLPLPLVRRYAKARGRVPADATEHWLLSEGIRGATYWEIVRALGPSARCLNRTVGDDVSAFWDRSLARSHQSTARLAVKRGLCRAHRLVDRLVFRPLGLPAVAFLPDLSLCLEKEADGKH